MFKSKKIKILLGVAAAAVFVYIFIMFFSANFSMVRTQSAVYDTVTDTIETTGYMLRNETYITNDQGGIVAFELPNGGSVAANGVIAKVYNSESDAAAQNKIKEIDSELSKLQKLNSAGKLTGSSVESINSVIISKMTELINDVHNNDLYDIATTKRSILYSINERQITTGKVDNFNERIAQLQTEKDNLSASAGKPIAEITSPVAGYFISYTDGYENAYDYKKADKLSSDNLSKLQGQDAQKVPSNVIGKVISNLNWYICCPVSNKDALKFNENYDNIKVKMPFASTESIPVNVLAVNQDKKSGNAVIILECKNMSEALATLRNETVLIDVKSYSGIKIPKKALHEDTVVKSVENNDGTTSSEKKKVQGVYVLYGNELIFKQVDVIYSGEDFVICSENPDEGKLFNGETVELYDRIVTGGSDLYAGKIVKQSK